MTKYYICHITQRHGEYDPSITFRFKINNESELNDYLHYYSRTWMGDSKATKFDKDDPDCTAYEHNGGEIVTEIESCAEISKELFESYIHISDLSDYEGDNYN